MRSIELQIRIAGRPYDPLPKQRAFHKSDAKFRAYIGGFGSGKTAAGCVEVVKQALLHPGSRGIVARLTEGELLRTTWATLLSILPPECIQDHIRGNFYIKLFNGAEIQGMHLQDEAKLRSENLDWCYVDEASEIKETVWKQLMGRLRGNTIGGRTPGPLKMWLTSNPEGRNWLYKTFVIGNHPGHAYFHAPTRENHYLPPEYVASLLQMYDEDWVRKFLEGSFDVFEGQVYPMFDRETHVLDWQPHQIPKEWPRYRGIDHGWADPFVCVWVAVDYEGNHFAYNMLYRKQQTIENNCRVVQEMSAGESYEYTVWDPSINQADPVTGRRLADIYNEYGIHGISANNALDQGIAKIREMLQPRPGRVHPATKESYAPRLYLLNHLKEGIWEFLQYHYPASDDNKNAPNKPVDVHNHFLDALRYVVMGLPANRDRPAVEGTMNQFIEHLLEQRHLAASGREF